MVKKKVPTSKTIKPKSSPSKKSIPKTDVDKIRALGEQLAQREVELAVINSIQSALASKMDFQGIIDIVGDKLNEIFRDGNVGIGFLDKTRKVTTFLYAMENGKRLDYFEISMDRPNLMNHILKRRRPVLINSKFRERFGGDNTINFPGRDQSDLKSWLSVPFLKDGEVIGGIGLRSWERENAFTESDVRLLQTVANSMIVALENARLLKETEQRATELQIINNIGQTLTEGLDLNSTLERVGERLREALHLKSIGIVANDTRTGLVIESYVYLKGKRVFPERSSWGKNMFGMRFAAKVGGKPLVVTTNVEKNWRKFIANVPLWAEIPKTFALVPLLADGELVGSITIGDYEDENAFVDLPLDLLETIASNMGTAIQNVRLFEETQRLLTQTDQRATELQIINNIGQTLTEGGDLENMIQRVGERIQEALSVNNIAISIHDKETEHVIAHYMVRNGEHMKLTEENFNLKRYKMFIRAWARAGGRGTSWAIIKDVDKVWQKSWLGSVADDVPKSLVALPLLAGGKIIGGISLADYEREDAFADISTGMLEIIAANMGTAIQNVRLFDETKKLFNEAEESRASAVQANKAKSTFLANMSHELRTPLNAIMGFTSIVKGKSEGILPEKQIGNLDKVLSSSQHLLSLINTVLDLAKIEAGRMDVIPAKFHISALVDQCGNLVTPLLKPNVILEKRVDESVGIVYSDQDKIKQIVLNLLSNAAKFTHAGRILLGVEKSDEDYISISVTDSGIGISEDALSRVFEEFQQADATTTRQYGGTGLGLAISRTLARLLGGDLTAASELGKGSTFTITIPIQYAKKPALRQAQDTASSDFEPDTVQSTESHAPAGTEL